VLPGRLATLALCLAAGALAYVWAPGPEPLRAGVAIFILVGALWVSQALHLSVTALIVPLLAVGAGIADLRTALAFFAHPIIFLFLGGFVLAAALQRQGLDTALALIVLRLAGGRRFAALLLLIGVTALLSMWISNTAAAAMMVPLALGLLHKDGEEPGNREQSFALLGVAYGASIGGIGTLVGSPPNAIAAAQAGIGFAEWLGFGIPLVVLLLPCMIGTLLLMLRPRLGGRVPVPGTRFVWTRERRVTAAVFGLAVAGWVGGAPLGRVLGIDADIDTIVALCAIVALVIGGAVDWRDIEQRTRWGVLVLFGGGLCLSAVMTASGAGGFLAQILIDALQGVPPFLVLAALVAFVVFLTELVSNTASAALLLPVLLGVGAALDLPPMLIAAAIAASASCAFMLPVATPPNAIVFATDRVTQSTMMRCGLVLNLVSIVVVAALVAAVLG
jgi:solute carrier family 13 (sodium-dependent dicarboxylate transporter), member 2/3/5